MRQYSDIIAKPTVPPLAKEKPFKADYFLQYQQAENIIPSEPVQELPQQENQKRRFRSYTKTQLLLIAMACFIFVAGLVVSFITLRADSAAKAEIGALEKNSGSGNSAVPSETTPSAYAVDSYRVAPNLPKLLIIPSLGIRTRILQVGVTTSSALGTPPNIYDTAWYTGSATPGEPASDGAVLIDGHVHGPTLPGVFMNIDKMKPGDMIEIVRGDNQVFNYSVIKVNRFSAKTLNVESLLSSAKPGSQGLNLITCGGPFDKKSWEYTQRVVVWAALE